MIMNQEALAMAINKLAEEIARLNVELALQKAQNIEKEQTINNLRQEIEKLRNNKNEE